MYGAPYKMYGASYILYVAANTCMVRAVLYCTVLRAFSHFHAIYRSFPYNSARNSYFPLHLCAGPVVDSGAQTGESQFRAESLESLLFWAERARACTISGACYHKMRAEFERWNLARRMHVQRSNFRYSCRTHMHAI